MPYEPKPGTGMMFINANRKSEKHPFFKGYLIDENGERVQFAAWIANDFDTGSPKQDKNGNKYFRLKREAPYPGGASKDNDQDDIPF